MQRDERGWGGCREMRGEREMRKGGWAGAGSIVTGSARIRDMLKVRTPSNSESPWSACRRVTTELMSEFQIVYSRQSFSRGELLYMQARALIRMRGQLPAACIRYHRLHSGARAESCRGMPSHGGAGAAAPPHQASQRGYIRISLSARERGERESGREGGRERERARASAPQ